MFVSTRPLAQGSRDSSPIKLNGEGCSTLLQPTQERAPAPFSPGYTFPTSTASFGLAPSSASAHPAPPSLPLRRDSLSTTSSNTSNQSAIAFTFADEQSSSSSSPTSAHSSASSSYKHPPPPFSSIPLCRSSEDSIEMELDSPPSPTPPAPQLAELSRLHHLAFESLRTSTLSTEEDFLSRLRRWEEEKLAMTERGLSVSPPTREGVRGLPCSPEDAVGEGGLQQQVEEEDDAMREAIESGDEASEEDEIAIILSPSLASPPVPTSHSSPIRMPSHPSLPFAARPTLRRSDTLEVEELSRKLRAGAMGLEDFEGVREWQERGRRR